MSAVEQRHYSLFDNFIIGLEATLRFKNSNANDLNRDDYPAKEAAETELTEPERRASIQMCRINHAGEVCAQALYAGQAAWARDPKQRKHLWQAAEEEQAHLTWCAKRLEELNGQPSFLNPVWAVGSFLIGSAASLAGDGWSLGFVVETEHQVERHLDGHLRDLSPRDHKSRAIFRQMREDEIHHANDAQAKGAYAFPLWVKMLMRGTSKVMTLTAKYV